MLGDGAAARVALEGDPAWARARAVLRARARAARRVRAALPAPGAGAGCRRRGKRPGRGRRALSMARAWLCDFDGTVSPTDIGAAFARAFSPGRRGRAASDLLGPWIARRAWGTAS